MNKEKLYQEICDWYNYRFNMKENGEIVEFCATMKNKHKHIDEALKSWLPTLKETNNDDIVWSEREIEFIESL